MDWSWRCVSLQEGCDDVFPVYRTGRFSVSSNGVWSDAAGYHEVVEFGVRERVVFAWRARTLMDGIQVIFEAVYLPLKKGRVAIAFSGILGGTWMATSSGLHASNFRSDFVGGNLEMRKIFARSFFKGTDDVVIVLDLLGL